MFVRVMVETFAALAEPTRLRIVEMLRNGPRPVGEICEHLPMSQPQVSKHLRVLRDAGLVAVEARAQQRIYDLRAAPLRELDRWLEGYRRFWEKSYGQLDDLLDEMKTREKHKTKKRTRRTPR